MIPRIVFPMLVVLEITNCVEVINFSKQFIDKLALKVVDRIETRMKVTTFSFIFSFHQILQHILLILFNSINIKSRISPEKTFLLVQGRFLIRLFNVAQCTVHHTNIFGRNPVLVLTSRMAVTRSTTGTAG